MNENFFNSRLHAVISLVLILLSVCIYSIKNLYFLNDDIYDDQIQLIEITISSIFLIEFLYRFFSSKNKINYIFSFSGVVDFLSSVPYFIGIAFGFYGNTSWAKILRLIIIIRVFKSFALNRINGGIFSKVLPYGVLALGLKLIVLSLEKQSWWVVVGQFNIVLGVIGFSLAVLMGAKLSVVNGKLYAIEDTICRIVGSMRDMWYEEQIQNELVTWSLQLEKFLKKNYENRKQSSNQLRLLTDNLEDTLEKYNVGGPNTAGFHRDVAYLVHRATVITPPAYNQFLMTITVLYIMALILGIPGGMGLISSFLSAVVLGGVYFLVEDLDDPLGNHADSFIDARLDALEYWNKSKEELIH